MRLIELQQDGPTLDEALRLAQDEVVLLRQRDGSVYALAHIDDYTLEVESLKSNPEFLALLKRWSGGLLQAAPVRPECSVPPSDRIS